MDKMKSAIGSSINANRHPYAKNDFKGTAEVRRLVAKTIPSKKTLPLMDNKDFYAFCQVKSILLEQPSLTSDSYSNAMRAFMDGWLEEQSK